MSFLHLVYVGDFKRDGAIMVLKRTSDDPILKPVVRRPIEPGLIERLVSAFPECQGAGSLPANWHIWPEDGYLVCDRYALGVEEIAFLRRLVEETDCRLFERSFEISVDDLSPRREVAGIRQDPAWPRA